MKTLFRYTLLILLAVSCGLSITLGIQKTVYALDDLRIEDEEMRQLVTVYHEVLQNYVEVEDASPSALMRGAVEGLLQKLDPYSQYFPPVEYKKFTEQTSGEFGGLGIRINIARKDAPWLPGWLNVVEPIRDTPATRCLANLDGREFVGLKPDDKIVKIVDEPTRSMPLEAAVDKLKGPPGTTVTIQIARRPLDGNPMLLDFTIERGVINVPPIEDDDIKMVNDEIGYIWLKDFTSNAHKALKQAIGDLEKEKNMKALVLDLRDNTGGLLPVAIEVCELFVDQREVVLSVVSRHKEDDQTYWSTKAPATRVPMAVLVNGNSASASEIVAGCIQDHRRGIIVGPEPGKSTYGKGSVQTVIQLEDGSGLKLTTAQWFTPKQQKIHGEGITADAASDMNFDYWLRLRGADRVAYLKPDMLPRQTAVEEEEDEAEAEVTMEELLGGASAEDDLKNLYDKQLFLAAQLLLVEIDSEEESETETAKAPAQKK